MSIADGYLEMGAEWMHGEVGNVVHGLASARNLARDAPSETLSEIFVRSNGEVVGEQMTHRMMEMSNEVQSVDAEAAKGFKNCGEFYVHL